MAGLLSFPQRCILHFKTHGASSFFRETKRRTAVFFYSRNTLLLHEKALLSDIPDLITKYGLDMNMRVASGDDLNALKHCVRMAERPLIDRRAAQGKRPLAAFNERGDVTGYLWMYNENDYIEELECRLADSAYIGDGFTVREYRNKGIMVALLQRALEIYKRENVGKVTITTLPDNKAIIKVISRYGFSPVKRVEIRRILSYKSIKFGEI